VKLSVEEFREWPNKCITLLGMSGVGKTWLSHILMRQHWFHYSGDYRIGTRYLDEPILDNIKQKAMQVPFLRDLLRSDSIYICNNITVNNLNPVSSFLGKLGDPEKDGLPLDEFTRRQHLHQEAETNAMLDVPHFIKKAQNIYGYNHFINDAGGSVCELDNPAVIECLSQHSLILYIKATADDEKALIQRARTDPKPMYYREEFLTEALANYLQEKDIPYISLIDPDDFVRWIFPRLLEARKPRYERLAKEYGYTVSSTEINQVSDEKSFLEIVERAIEKSSSLPK